MHFVLERTQRQAIDILNNNQYMTLGTISVGNKRVGSSTVTKGARIIDSHAWVSPVAYAFDKKYNLYFISLPGSQHSNNMKKNAMVSAAIFDSRQTFGEGKGLQILGKAGVVPVRDSVPVFKYYFSRKWPYGSLTNIEDFKRFFKLYKYRFYKVEPIEVWMNDSRKEYDSRVKVRF
ncbi:MAG: hypothetical protein JW922_09965 [Paludibacteraceae bacterium]|nr:hypothetical protein [Paludibacteraceae bacterium]